MSEKEIPQPMNDEERRAMIVKLRSAKAKENDEATDLLLHFAIRMLEDWCAQFFGEEKKP